MNEIASASPFNREWFNFNGTSAVVKEEYRDKFNKALAQKIKENTESANVLNEKTRLRNTDIVLTEEQKAYLSEKYDPRNMSKDEFGSFVDDLCTYGVLQKEDKEIVFPSKFVTALIGPIVYITTQTQNWWMDYNYSSCNNNALDWTRHLSSFESYNTVKQTFEKDARTILFGIIYDALEQIKA